MYHSRTQPDHPDPLIVLNFFFAWNLVRRFMVFLSFRPFFQFQYCAIYERPLSTSAAVGFSTRIAVRCLPCWDVCGLAKLFLFRCFNPLLGFFFLFL